MAQLSTLAVEIDIKTPAENFYNTLKGKTQTTVSDIAPDHLHKVDVHEGDGETSGSIKQLTFKVGDTVETLKEKIHFDDGNKIITYTVFEGDLLKHYNSYKVTLQVTTKGVVGLVRWSWEYEKLNDDAPEPTKYLELLVNLTKKIEAHLIKA
ncbi:Major latex protein-like [Quillaja saponaria]|uniref:Major latex protein-like n=1 Tax=Quillaja saponaria TaxID=32244 RepID=A0AAD7L9Y7_QUISA|nr:Major latex protein-like [Quillaja saponaria]